MSSGTDGIRIYIFEKIRSDKQCFGNGIVVFSTQVGSFFASISAWFFSLDFMPSYSWRIAFLIGSCMGLLSIILRMTHKISNDNDNLQDPDYQSYKDQNIFKIAFHNSKLFILSSITAGCIGSTYQFIIIFFGTYNFELLKLVDQQMMQLCTSLGVILYMVFAVVGGAFADVVGKVRAANIASIALVALSGIFALIISYNRFPLSLYFLIIIILPFVTMPALTLIKQSIPKVIRYRLFSLAHAFGSIFLSAPTAYVSTSLYYYSELSWLPVLYFLSTILIMIFCINQLSKISSHPLNKPLNNL
ncbi:MAG: MFS transporter [Alphaproteobacteria bacterium]|nr:MFS transporter [Alphaproteobacteria bacterium]